MATKSIGTAGRDFSTLASYTTTYLNALTNIAVAERGECYNDSTEFTAATRLTIGGYTLAGGSVTLTCAAGQSFRDNASVQSNALRYNAANGVGYNSTLDYDIAVLVTGPNLTIDGLQIKNVRSASQWILWSQVAAGATDFIVKNCIIYGISNNNSRALVLSTGGANSATIQNCAIIVTGTTGGAIQYSANAGSPIIEETSILSSNASGGIGVDMQSQTITVVRNVAVAGFTTDYNGTASASSTNNATDKGSFGGTNFGASGQVSLVGTTEWQSVTNGSEDLRLNSTSAKLKNNGVTAGPNTDIAGTSRPQGANYDIGCWELVTAAGVSLGELAAVTNPLIMPPVRSSRFMAGGGQVAISAGSPTELLTVDKWLVPLSQPPRRPGINSKIAVFAPVIPTVAAAPTFTVASWLVALSQPGRTTLKPQPLPTVTMAKPVPLPPPSIASGGLMPQTQHKMGAPGFPQMGPP